MKKTNKKYIIVALVALLAIGGTFVYTQNLNHIETNEQVEPTVARIDLNTKPYTEKANFEVYITGSETPENEAIWMPKHNARGYTLQKEGTEITFSIKVLNNVDIIMGLRGKWEFINPKDEEEGLKENWVDFTSITIDGEEILPKTTAVWHYKPFTYVINAKAGETYNVVAKWQKHEESAE